MIVEEAMINIEILSTSHCGFHYQVRSCAQETRLDSSRMPLYLKKKTLVITKRERKKIDWIRQKTQVTDAIHRIKALGWQWAGHLAREPTIDGPHDQSNGTHETQRDPKKDPT